MGDRQIRKRFDASGQREYASREYQLEDQDERHNSHGCCGRANNTGNKQGRHIRSVSNKEQCDCEIQKIVLCDKAVCRKRYPNQCADIDRDDGLQGTQDCLEDHVRQHVGGNMQPRAVFPLYNAALPADHLDLIKESIP